MKGILLLSHGTLSKGMYETTQWFMGEDIPQYDYLCLEPDDSPEAFDEKIKAKLEALDTGEGAIFIVDLMGGTPFNRSATFMAQGVDVFTGLNLPLVLELLGKRLFDEYDMEGLEQIGKDGVVYVNKLFAGMQASGDDE
ncbi:MAG: PTS mannose transporter subunit IIA [Erysipelotrichaceae bacterium]|nr:PTS mannose transporter subunit IIA [Erysipelotrichaceae bacterium]